ncbi:hypothetical protein [Xanthomonas vesicatoria]|uniref:hypothetical protein n=1 Tax=Xanthomonas vesicatoria TaxID=56460 RepID=UPI000F8E1DB8|nr:hypothetical protein [Xanthomonas vesicatoria]
MGDPTAEQLGKQRVEPWRDIAWRSSVLGPRSSILDADADADADADSVDTIGMNSATAAAVSIKDFLKIACN